jgi:hypothetical protein
MSAHRIGLALFLCCMILAALPSVAGERYAVEPSEAADFTAIPGPDAVELSWEPPASSGSGDIAHYDIIRRSYGDSNDPLLERTIATVGPEVFHYVDDEVVAGAYYLYTVKCTNTDGAASYSKSWVVSLDKTVPSAPLNLRMEAGEGWIDLRWTGPSDEGGTNISVFKVYRSCEGGDAVVIGTFPGGAREPGSGRQGWFTDEGLEIGANYTYSVSACNYFGEGQRTSFPPVRVHYAPQNLTLSEYTSPDEGPMNVTLYWNAPSQTAGVEAYRVIIDDNGHDRYLIVDDRTFNRTVQVDSTTAFRVAAVYGDGSSSISENVLFVYTLPGQDESVIDESQPSDDLPESPLFWPAAAIMALGSIAGVALIRARH